MSQHQQHHHGLQHDLKKLAQQALDRRQALGLIGGMMTSLVVLPLMACSSDDEDIIETNIESTTDTTTSTGTSSTDSTGSGTTSGTSTGSTSTTDNTSTTTTTANSCTQIPTETAGPYPGDGTNGSSTSGTINALTQSGIARRSMVSSFGTATGVAQGVPLTVKLSLVNINQSCAPLSGLAIYLWHCDAQGKYSLYSQGITNENYLRAVQTTDNSGVVTFETIFPGCYDGRWPHMHFEIFASLDKATTGRSSLKISQLAMPQAACSQVYNANSQYSTSISNLSRITLSSDNVFGNDSAMNQLGTVTGTIDSGLTVSLQVGVSV